MTGSAEVDRVVNRAQRIHLLSVNIASTAQIRKISVMPSDGKTDGEDFRQNHQQYHHDQRHKQQRGLLRPFVLVFRRNFL